MSFDLVVLAVDPGPTDAEVWAKAEHCRSLHHPEGELDERIIVSYENLRARYLDFPAVRSRFSVDDDALTVGIDHVSMHLSFGERGGPALQLIDELARPVRTHD
jgi:hypothetical protein